MGTYTVVLDADQEIALQYALELALAAIPPPEEGQEPPPAPTLETMPQVLVAADLANRTRDLASLVAPTLGVLQALGDAHVRQAILLALPSPALRTYLEACLAGG